MTTAELSIVETDAITYPRRGYGRWGRDVLRDKAGRSLGCPDGNLVRISAPEEPTA
jgi:hypothetical protein